MCVIICGTKPAAYFSNEATVVSDGCSSTITLRKNGGKLYQAAARKSITDWEIWK